MSGDMFINIDGIPGESTDSKHKDIIDVDSFTFGVQQTSTGARGGGSGAGKALFQDLVVMKRADKASPGIMQACASGKHIPKATLIVRKAGGAQIDYYTVLIEGVFITNFAAMGTGDSGEKPSEQVSLSYTKITFDYSIQKEDGSKGAVSKGTWNLATNKA